MVLTATVNESSFRTAEFWRGTDPGVGAATTVTVSYVNGQVVVSVPLAGVPVGTYDFGLRVQDAAGNWSNTLTVPVTVTRSLAIFSDTFDSGTLAAWSGSTGNVTVTAAAAIPVGGTNRGLAATLSGRTANRPSYVVDTTPAAETTYDAQFDIVANTLTTGTGGASIVNLFATRSDATAQVYALQYRGTASNPQVRVVLNRSGGLGPVNGAWVALGTGRHTLKTAWRAGPATGAGAGTVVLRRDGVVVSTLTGSDHRPRRRHRLARDQRWGHGDQQLADGGHGLLRLLRLHPGRAMTAVGAWGARLGRWGWLAAAAMVLALVAGGVATARVVWHDPAPAGMPLNADLEQSAGIRFTRVVVVADGGLLEASYVVLDPDKATRFQSDRQHPPAIESEERSESTSRVALMKQGHADACRAVLLPRLQQQRRGGPGRRDRTDRLQRVRPRARPGDRMTRPGGRGTGYPSAAVRRLVLPMILAALAGVLLPGVGTGIGARLPRLQQPRRRPGPRHGPHRAPAAAERVGAARLDVGHRRGGIGAPRAHRPAPRTRRFAR